MGIRDTINRYPRAAAAFSSMTVAVVLVSIFLRSRPSGPPRRRAFYTTDDGATLFVDDWEKVPPFDHDGQPAVRAFVFTCDDGKTQFVEYLEKYSDEVKQRMDGKQLQTSVGLGLIKKPGSGPWVSESDAKKARAIIAPPCPDAMGKGQYRQVAP
jgi:hypothetical protein